MEVQLYLHEVLNCNLCRCVQLTFCDTPVTVFVETAASVQGFFHVSFICFGQSASRQLARQTGSNSISSKNSFLIFSGHFTIHHEPLFYVCLIRPDQTLCCSAKKNLGQLQRARKTLLWQKPKVLQLQEHYCKYISLE